MNFQKLENGRLTVTELPDIQTAREIANEIFELTTHAAEFIELRQVKGSTSFTVKDRYRKILFQLKQLQL